MKVVRDSSRTARVAADKAAEVAKETVDGLSRLVTHKTAVYPGKPYPLGATWDGEGVNFTLFAENAAAVWVCLFDEAESGREKTRVRLPEVTAHVWHGYLPGLKPGQLYGFRVDGPYAPARGLRYNAAKLLVDPYAKALEGKVDWRAPVFGYPLGHPDQDLERDDNDDAWGVPKGVVVDPAFDWDGDRLPRVPYNQSIIYETHVRGLTMRHPDVPDELRGTYAGLANPAVVNYLRELGITAVELLPVHAYLDDKFLHDKGLTNYWGYNTLNFFAPEGRYASARHRGGQVEEFKRMVRTLHKAGIEVILDVVYNHTAEGNHLGPTLSWKGIDNTSYYRLVAGNPRYYMDYTGTGNSLNARHPQTLKLIMDSLRYWVLEMHVDGFRFDLASTLARELHEVDRLSAFFDIVHQDPIISRVKLIAEPWDVGEGGYQVGNFPVVWTEWNGKYRDAVRRYWRGDERTVGELAARLTGSSDLYGNDGRKPYHSINFVTAHDGFTLADLVAYNSKHNESNREENRDGCDYNLSWNSGAEGPTDDPAVRELRERQKRNLMATLLLSQGVPMILGGDEIGRTQHGNNNAYCQDNELSWHDWDLDERARKMLAFTKRLVQVRLSQPVLRPRKFLTGRRIRGSDIKDITWLRPDGKEMTDKQWEEACMKVLGMRLAGDGLNERDEQGERIVGDTLLILMNAHDGPVKFVLPESAECSQWELMLDTFHAETAKGAREYRCGEKYTLGGRSLALFRQQT